MNTKEAIMAFSQSEKIKSGIIWVSQLLELLRGLPEPEKQGAEKAIKLLVDMIFQEIQLRPNMLPALFLPGIVAAEQNLKVQFHYRL